MEDVGGEVGRARDTSGTARVGEEDGNGSSQAWKSLTSQAHTLLFWACRAGDMQHHAACSETAYLGGRVFLEVVADGAGNNDAWHTLSRQ